MDTPVFELFKGFLIARLPTEGEPDGKTILSAEQAAAHFRVDPPLLQEFWDRAIGASVPRLNRELDPAVESALNDIALRRQHQHLPEEFFQQFVRRCLASGLDPWTSGLNPEVQFDARANRRKLVFIASINLMRSMAARHPRYISQRGPLFQRQDGTWVDCWTSDEPPLAAKIGVVIKDDTEPLWAIATWKNYAPLAEDPQTGKLVVIPLWQEKPDQQLACAAEGLGLRRAFGDILGGVYCHAEMEQSRHPRRAVRSREVNADEVSQIRDGPRPAAPSTGLRYIPDDSREPVMTLD